MNILGIETTSSKGTVALVIDGRLVTELELEKPLRHSRYVISAIDRMLADAKLHITNIDRIAVGIGPGSFTGIRVGIAIAKGLNADGSMRLAGIPSLKNIAVQISSKQIIAAYAYAQRNEFFVQQFICEGVGKIQPYSDCAIFTADAMKSIIPESAVLVGPDYAKLQQYGEQLGCRIHAQPVYPRAQYAAILATAEDDTLPEDDLIPLYVRRSEAEEKGAKVYTF